MLAGAPRLDRRPELGEVPSITRDYPRDYPRFPEIPRDRRAELGEVPLVAIVPERVSVLVEVVLIT